MKVTINKVLIASTAITAVAITLVIPDLALAAVRDSAVGMSIYSKIAIVGTLGASIKGVIEVIQGYMGSDWARIKTALLQSGAIVAIIVLYPTFIDLVEATAKGMK